MSIQKTLGEMSAEEVADYMKGCFFIVMRPEDVVEQIELRRISGIYQDCKCTPKDVRTYSGWIANGFSVRKGERSLSVRGIEMWLADYSDFPCPENMEPDEDGASREVEERVFCFCQVVVRKRERVRIVYVVD